MKRPFYWSVAPLGLCLRLGALGTVAAVAHWVHTMLPVWGMPSFFA